MGWATHYILRLQAGEEVSFRPRGNSMTPKIKSGQLCTVVPVLVSELAVGDVVLCKVHGTEFLHFVKAIQDGRVQIGNAHGHFNGWTKAVYGRLVRVEP